MAWIGAAVDPTARLAQPDEVRPLPASPLLRSCDLHSELRIARGRR